MRTDYWATVTAGAGRRRPHTTRRSAQAGLGRLAQVAVGDGLAAGREPEGQNPCLDVGGQNEQVHDLGQARAGEAVVAGARRRSRGTRRPGRGPARARATRAGRAWRRPASRRTRRPSFFCRRVRNVMVSTRSLMTRPPRWPRLRRRRPRRRRPAGAAVGQAGRARPDRAGAARRCRASVDQRFRPRRSSTRADASTRPLRGPVARAAAPSGQPRNCQPVLKPCWRANAARGRTVAAYARRMRCGASCASKSSCARCKSHRIWLHGLLPPGWLVAVDIGGPVSPSRALRPWRKVAVRRYPITLARSLAGRPARDSRCGRAQRTTTEGSGPRPALEPRSSVDAVNRLRDRTTFQKAICSFKLARSLGGSSFVERDGVFGFLACMKASHSQNAQPRTTAMFSRRYSNHLE